MQVAHKGLGLFLNFCSKHFLNPNKGIHCIILIGFESCKIACGLLLHRGMEYFGFSSCHYKHLHTCMCSSFYKCICADWVDSIYSLTVFTWFFFQDVLILSQFLRPDGCLLPRSVTGVCQSKQRKLAMLVRKAQQAGEGLW